MLEALGDITLILISRSVATYNRHMIHSTAQKLLSTDFLSTSSFAATYAYMLILGLTGGIASGKSTVSRKLKDQGYPIVDADMIAKQVVEPGKPAYNKIVEYFGPITPDLVTEEGLNRAALGSTVFGNETHRKVLNGIIHPAVRKEMIWQILGAWVVGNSIVVLDVPLLFEAKMHQMCGSTIVVTCSDEKQLERLLARDPQLSKKDAEERIRSQMPSADKAKLADFVIDNDGSLDDLYSAVDKTLKQVQPNPLTTFFEWIPPIGAGVAAFRYFQKAKI